jgi:beta-galactosidase
MGFYIKEGSFYLDDRKIFLNSGEIHYFRIRRELWDRHLDAAKEAGLTVVSTYVPWAWHEAEEGVFDFEGITIPERDLRGWLRRCEAHGLKCILKPGPFILAEFRGAGLPDWFLERYGDDVRMHDSKGDIVVSEGVSLFNPIYLEKVRLWYDRVMPLIRDFEIAAGGPVIMMQICNEIGVFSWLARQGDYNPVVREKFSVYLKHKFPDIEALNRLWETDYPDFSQVELPPDGKQPYASKGDRSRDYEWHCFWRTYYGDYLRMLVTMARERGITVLFYHNLPGWIYGHGYEFPVNITMYDDLFGDKSEIIFGVDHIPEFLSHRNLHDDRIINDITAAMQEDSPLFAAEFQSGSREFHVVTNPHEMELFYKAGIANGLTGWNYYMFSQGQNPYRKGYSGDTFYWFTPLLSEGERTSAFPLVKRMNSLVRVCENLIVNARRKAEICVLFYPPYYATELERPYEGGCGIQFLPSAIRRPAYFDGLLKVLQLLNVDYDMADLTKVSSGELLSYKQVWAFCTDEMNAGDQQTIVNYMKDGGNLVIFPCLPDREMTQKPCTIIRDSLSVASPGVESIFLPLIDVFDRKDIKCANPQMTYPVDSLAGAEIIARTISGKVCGFSKPIGNGSVIHLGAWIGFDTESHVPVYESILQRSGARIAFASASEPLVVRQRFTALHEGILFIANYYNEEHTGKVTYTHPETGEAIAIPYMEEKMAWPPLYGVLTPVCLEITDGLKVLHTTSDILGIEVTKDQISITVYGDRDLSGEMIFEGVRAGRIRSATISGKPVKMTDGKKRMVLSYHHEHRKEMILIIKLN